MLTRPRPEPVAHLPRPRAHRIRPARSPWWTWTLILLRVTPVAVILIYAGRPTGW